MAAISFRIPRCVLSWSDGIFLGQNLDNLLAEGCRHALPLPFGNHRTIAGMGHEIGDLKPGDIV